MQPCGTKETVTEINNHRLLVDLRLIFICRAGLLTRFCSGDNLYFSLLIRQ